MTRALSSVLMSACKRCLKCCYRVLYRYSLHSSAFSNLYIAYQYLLTQSFSLVSCERAFSKLKIIKTRLRTSLGDDKLKTFMLMSSEKNILDSVTLDDHNQGFTSFLQIAVAESQSIIWQRCVLFNSVYDFDLFYLLARAIRADTIDTCYEHSCVWARGTYKTL